MNSPGTAVSVDIEAVSGTATQDLDFLSSAATLNFTGSGSETLFFTVPVVGDITVEQDEEFFVTLSNVSNPGVALTNGTGKIQNDDKAKLKFVVPEKNQCDDAADPRVGACVTFHEEFLFLETKLNGELEAGVLARIHFIAESSKPHDFQDYTLDLFFAGNAGEEQKTPLAIREKIGSHAPEKITAIIEILDSSGILIANDVLTINIEQEPVFAKDCSGNPIPIDIPNHNVGTPGDGIPIPILIVAEYFADYSSPTDGGM